MQIDPNIRTAKSKDAYDVIRLVAQLYTHAYGKEGAKKKGFITENDIENVNAIQPIKDLIIDPSYEILIVEDDSKVMGTIVIETRQRIGRRNKEKWIPSISVDQNYRQMGVATKLLSETEKRTIEQGCSRILAEVVYSNLEGNKLFERNGYQPTAQQYIKYP